MMSTQAIANNVSELDDQLNRQVLAGDILGAFDRFYAEGVVMQENNAEPVVGKAANRAREEAFLASVEQFHGARVLSTAVNGNVTFSEWELDATYKGAGRILLAQVAVREWKDGLVVRERFYYGK
ncbi:MAG: nuclear transport factor 2 family protein [Bryobacteraceae bacterium]|nr:nuclear transport factor 2 family protein [Bryobacteraceae bacterium]